MATKAGKSWLHATLTVKSNKTSERGGLPASGMFLINPPFNLKDQLKPAMPQLVAGSGQQCRLYAGVWRLIAAVGRPLPPSSVAGRASGFTGRPSTATMVQRLRLAVWETLRAG
jgi:hypothetical protein